MISVVLRPVTAVRAIIHPTNYTLINFPQKRDQPESVGTIPRTYMKKVDLNSARL